MTPDVIVSRLREFARCCDEACRRSAYRQMRKEIRRNQRTALEAADAILQLQDRLVRQACYFEQIEARTQPKTWPLLEDDDAGDGL